jgi:hypothetical protein
VPAKIKLTSRTPSIAHFFVISNTASPLLV